MLSVQNLLNGKPTNKVISVKPDAMVIDALEVMAEYNIGAVMVIENDRLVGIFSERDYARKGIIQGRKAKSTPLTDVMTHNVFSVSSSMSIDDCMKLFSEKKIRHLPVVDEGRVKGMLSVGDIVTAIIREQKTHIQFLEQYISAG